MRKHEKSVLDAQAHATNFSAEKVVADSKQQRREAEVADLQASMPCLHRLFNIGRQHGEKLWDKSKHITACRKADPVHPCIVNHAHESLIFFCLGHILGSGCRACLDIWAGRGADMAMVPCRMS